MKIKILLLLSFFSSNIFGQTKDSIYPEKNGIVNYNEIITTDSIKKSKLYINAKKWIVNTYKSAKNVIQLDDKESGEIILKGNSEVFYDKMLGMGVSVNVNHVFKISIRDFKYKYELTEFSIDKTEALYSDFLKNNTPLYHKKAVRKFRDAFDKQMKLYLLSFKIEMLKTDPIDNF